MKRVLSVLLCCGTLLSLAACKKEPVAPEPQVTEHQHVFGEWGFHKNASCQEEGAEKRTCAECGTVETRPIPKLLHEPNKFNICQHCWYVDFDQNAAIVELGIPTTPWYSDGAAANCIWDLTLWNGKLFRGAGDYDKNSGKTVIWSYTPATQRWRYEFETSDEAIHRYMEIDGKLYAPGVDPTAGWELGNYYVYDGKWWTLVRNLPNGIHNFDMVEFDGKIFAGLGVSAPNFPLVMSADKGKTYTFVPFYKDGQKVNTTGMSYIRVYEFIIFNDQLYAYTSMGTYSGFYRFEGDKMVWVGSSNGYVRSSSTNFNYFTAKFQLDDTLFLVSDQLLAVKSFDDPKTVTRVELPQKEFVNDALLADGLMYVLAYRQKDDGTYQTVIYSSKTGTTGSFTEVLHLDYAVPPTCFNLVDGYFYIGMGSKRIIHEKNGMLLRVKLPA